MPRHRPPHGTRRGAPADVPAALFRSIGSNGNRDRTFWFYLHRSPNAIWGHDMDPVAAVEAWLLALFGVAGLVRAARNAPREDCDLADWD